MLRRHQLQKELLLAAIDSCNANAAGGGGHVVYLDVLSVSVEENEEVVAYALAQRHVKLVDSGLEFEREGFTRYRAKRSPRSSCAAASTPTPTTWTASSSPSCASSRMPAAAAAAPPPRPPRPSRRPPPAAAAAASDAVATLAHGAGGPLPPAGAERAPAAASTAPAAPSR